MVTFLFSVYFAWLASIATEFHAISQSKGIKKIVFCWQALANTITFSILRSEGDLGKTNRDEFSGKHFMDQFYQLQEDVVNSSLG